jgi:DNA-binding transcriptional LysR family regulator
VLREPQLKIVWLEQYLMLYREQDMTQAAMKLDISLATLQRNIRLLEQRVGTALIQREGKKFYITPEGRLLGEEAQQFFTGINQLPMQLKRELAGQLQGTVAVAWQSALSFNVLADVLAQFISDYPDVYVRSSVCTQSLMIEKRLQKGQLDVALMIVPPGDESLLVGSGRPIPYVIVSCPQPQRHWSTFAYVETVQELPAELRFPWDEERFPRAIVAKTNMMETVLFWAKSGVASYIPLSLAEPYIREGKLAIVATPPEEKFIQSYVCAAPAGMERPAVQIMAEQILFNLQSL